MKTDLPSWEVYGNYKSGNYGAHALVFTIGHLRVWFSYQTPVAFAVGNADPIVRRNGWGPTTGKHLNAIDGGNKKTRLPGDAFEAQLRGVLAETT